MKTKDVKDDNYNVTKGQGDDRDHVTKNVEWWYLQDMMVILMSINRHDDNVISGQHMKIMSLRVQDDDDDATNNNVTNATWWIKEHISYHQAYQAHGASIHIL